MGQRGLDCKALDQPTPTDRRAVKPRAVPAAYAKICFRASSQMATTAGLRTFRSIEIA